MTATITSATTLGLHAHPIRVEVDISPGLPQLNIVGLPDTSIRESRDRVRAAIRNSGFEFPAQKITINLAPADMKKEGPAFDLPIAIGILIANGEIESEQLRNQVFMGELALDGQLRAFPGSLIIASDLHESYEFILPEENAKDCAMIPNSTLYGFRSLKDVVEYLKGSHSASPTPSQTEIRFTSPACITPNFKDVKGQTCAKRAIEIAVAGGHNILMIGPPGSGKTMLARRIPGILPAPSFDEYLEMSKIYSYAPVGHQKSPRPHNRPFRAPHHTASAPAMVGGGSWPRPGEVSLAHHGVLFLDELPEFKKDVLEALRTPLEDGIVSVSRTKLHIQYPANFLLVAAMNPCPCGYFGDPKRNCRCSLHHVHKYRNKVSGPILDRIDIHIEVPSLPFKAFSHTSIDAESSENIRARVQACRAIQNERFKLRRNKTNSSLKPKDLKICASLDAHTTQLLEQAVKQLRLSARGYFKIIKIARTIADLASSKTIQQEHVAEAIQYRSLDRQWWS